MGNIPPLIFLNDGDKPLTAGTHPDAAFPGHVLQSMPADKKELETVSGLQPCSCCSAN
jgi:hypothetical protein